MTFTASDHRMMGRALQLAARGLDSTPPNPRVGCVIVQGEAIVGEGWHERTGGPHAEVVALRDAGERARGATAYVSLEPCCHEGRTPPCTDALRDARVARVVYAAADPNPRVNGGGEKLLRSLGIAVEGGLMSAEAERLNAGFFSRMRRGRPLLRMKIASTLDGRVALADGRSQWITGEAARRDVHRWRAQSGAVLTGIGTILADDPRLDVRSAGPDILRQPPRVILDSAFRTPPGARVLSVPGEVIVLGAGPEAQRIGLEERGARVIGVPLQAARVDLAEALHKLAEMQVNDVWVEAGPVLNGALLAAGLVDELVLYQAASVLGADARGMFAIPPLGRLDDRPVFRLREVRAVGDDLRLILVPRSAGEVA